MSILSNAQALKNALIEIPLASPEYPAEWRGLSDPPAAAYAIGDISLLRGRKFALVGSRRTPANALKLGGEIAKELSIAFVLVTGTADGGDTAAIEGALSGSGRVICLLAGGFSALPQANLSLLERVAKRGLLLSFQPFDTPVRTFSYEQRNKLLALLGEGTLVLGAGEKSGALITAKYAVEHGRAVFALPYPPNSACGCGCNRLIKEGGRLVENAADITSFYGIRIIEEKKQIPLSGEEERVYEALRENAQAHAGELAQIAQIPPYKIRAVLSALEVKGLVVSLGGNRYAAI